MSVKQKFKICTAEDVDQKDGTTKRVYYRVGHIITFIDDATKNEYQRAKISLFPGTKLYIFPEEIKSNRR